MDTEETAQKIMQDIKQLDSYTEVVQDLSTQEESIHKILLSEIKTLKETLNNLDKQVAKYNEEVEKYNQNLTNHINFINSVFNYLKRPMFFIADKINRLYSLKN